MPARTLIVSLAVALAMGVCRPAQAASPDNLLGGYSLTSWTDGDGIPLGTVYVIRQDRDGYLWIGTDAGLLRFDGVRFTPWNTLSETRLPAAPASALWVARDGSLWVGLMGGGVKRIRGSQILPQDQPQGTLGSVTDIVEDHGGTVWAVSDGALFRVRGARWEPVPVMPGGREPLVQRLFVGSQGQLWVATARGGVLQRIDDRDTFQRMAAGFTWDVHEDAAGTIWTTDIVAGFRMLGEPSPRPQPFAGSGYRLAHDRRGNLWIATLGEGLWRARPAADRATRRVERTALRTGLSSDSVQSLLEDRDGNLWVGTTAGLHRLTERRLTPIENVGFVVDVAAVERGVEAGTTNGLIGFPSSGPSDPRAGREPATREPPRGPALRTLFRDAQATLWLGTNDGAWRMSGGAFSRVLLPKPPSTAITVITSAAAGGVWFGYDNWLHRWDGRTATPLDLSAHPEVKTITQAYTDSSGRLWLAHDLGRVAVVEENGTFRPIDSREGLADGTQPFFESRDRAVWAAGHAGISRLAGGPLITITRDNGFPASRVWSIVEDDAGYLWLSVDRGLIRVKPEELAKAAADRAYRVPYKLYDPSDGLAGAPLGNIRSARGADGHLWFVRGGGLTEVDPKGLGELDVPSSGPVRIEAVVANEQRLTPDPLTSLPAGTRRLQISYTSVALTASNKVHFRYRLDGFDTDWVDAGTRRQAFYTNLSPGPYRLRVEANSEDGTWNASTAAWDFVIQPAFYQTRWFYAATFGVVGLMLAGAWRVRLRRVRREFSLVLAERARLSREIHDTLLQSLVGVALQFDAIANTLDRASSAREQLVRIRRHVEAYIREARQSIWDLRSPVLETHDLLEALREFGKQAAAGTAVRFGATVSGTPRRCSPKVENQLLRIGQEAITNAVRHAAATRIALELRFDENAVTLRVSDDGRGFAYEYPAHDTDNHYGLTTMRERAEELGGRFKIATGIGRGTAIETSVPLPSGTS